MIDELAQHVGNLRRGNTNGHAAERAAEITEWLLINSRRTAAEHVAAGMDVHEALRLVDAEKYRDRRMLAPPKAEAA